MMSMRTKNCWHRDGEMKFKRREKMKLVLKESLLVDIYS